MIKHFSQKFEENYAILLKTGVINLTGRPMISCDISSVLAEYNKIASENGLFFFLKKGSRWSLPKLKYLAEHLEYICYTPPIRGYINSLEENQEFFLENFRKFFPPNINKIEIKNNLGQVIRVPQDDLLSILEDDTKTDADKIKRIYESNREIVLHYP